MKAEKIENNLIDLRARLIENILKTGITASAEICGLKQPDVTYFVKTIRCWSYRKVIKMAHKMGL